MPCNSLLSSYSRNDWLDKIEGHQKNILPIGTIQKSKNWFEYLYNEEDPGSSHYRCRLCYKYYDKFLLPANSKNALAYEKGTLKSSKETNREAIKNHPNIAGTNNIQ